AIPIEKRIPLIGSANAISEHGAELAAKSAIRVYDAESGIGVDYISADLKGNMKMSRKSFFGQIGMQNITADLSVSLTGGFGELLPGIGMQGAVRFKSWEFAYGLSKNLHSTLLIMPYKEGAVTYFRMNWWQK
ncbi:MAG: hypothetical protein JNL74_04675, partial [Fibrobacteres bacterium]|nr:hypothetical protein [Fibrobacterota bacterium]